MYLVRLVQGVRADKEAVGVGVGGDGGEALAVEVLRQVVDKSATSMARAHRMRPTSRRMITRRPRQYTCSHFFDSYLIKS